MGPEFWRVWGVLTASAFAFWALGSGLRAVGSGLLLGSGLWLLWAVCIGFGSGVLPGFAFCFCNLFFGWGGRLAGSAFWLAVFVHV